MGMSVSSGRGGKGRVGPNMNVTPLVDVVLVLLIIFMVVTPLLTKNFWLNLPKKDTSETPPAPDDPDKPVILTVDSQGVIKINKQVVPRAELKEKLRRIFAARKDQILFFDAENDAPYGIATEAMDLARAGGARTISILTERPQ